MIYSRFGTKLTPVSKERDASGRISIQVTVEGFGELRNYVLTDLQADDGMPEINEILAKLPWRIVETKAQRRVKKL